MLIGGKDRSKKKIPKANTDGRIRYLKINIIGNPEKNTIKNIITRSNITVDKFDGSINRQVMKLGRRIYVQNDLKEGITSL